jgi:predicted small lipoprotein YifL
MKLHRVIAITACAAALGLSACGEKCPTETPQVDAVANCTATAGSTVTVPVRLCPTCNQSAASCDVDLSQATSSGSILLDPVVEACESSNSCPPGCSLNSINCTFTAPSQLGSYELIVFNPATNTSISKRLDVVASGGTSCAF